LVAISDLLNVQAESRVSPAICAVAQLVLVPRPLDELGVIMQSAECQGGRYLRLERVVVERRTLRADDALICQSLDEYWTGCPSFWCETHHVVVFPGVSHGEEVEACDTCCRLVGYAHSVGHQCAIPGIVVVNRFERFDWDILSLHHGSSRPRDVILREALPICAVCASHKKCGEKGIGFKASVCYVFIATGWSAESDREGSTVVV